MTTTFQITANLPTSIEVESRGQTVTLDVEKLIGAQGADIITQAALHGIHQKIGDAAASALKDAFEAADGPKDATPAERKAWGEDHAEQIDAEALSMMESAVRNLTENGWTSRRIGSTADPLDAYRAQAVREIITADKTSKAYKAYAKIDAKDQAARREYLLGLAAKNAKAIDPIAQTRFDEAEAARKAARNIALEL